MSVMNNVRRISIGYNLILVELSKPLATTEMDRISRGKDYICVFAYHSRDKSNEKWYQNGVCISELEVSPSEFYFQCFSEMPCLIVSDNSKFRCGTPGGFKDVNSSVVGNIRKAYNRLNPCLIWNQTEAETPGTVPNSVKVHNCPHLVFENGDEVRYYDLVERTVPSYRSDLACKIVDEKVFERAEINDHGTLLVRTYVNTRKITFSRLEVDRIDMVPYRDDGPAIIEQKHLIETTVDLKPGFNWFSGEYTHDWHFDVKIKGGGVKNRNPTTKRVLDACRDLGIVLSEGPCTDRPAIQTGQDRMIFLSDFITRL